MRLSFVIPCYNMEKYLRKCIDSLIDQDIALSDYEIIVVNDESKDTTLKIAQEYAGKYPNIRIVDKKNAGVGAARNSGLDVAKGNYIYFLDPDDYLAKNVLAKLLRLIESNQLDILTFKSLSVFNDDNDTSENINTAIGELAITDGIGYIANRKYQNEIWWYMIDRQFLIATGIRFIEGKWMEDAILTAQLFCKTTKMAHVALDIHRYRILPTSAMRNKSPGHYNKVIFDNANAAHVFADLINGIPDKHANAESCKNRLRTRQQSFVFFLLVRLMKSDISIKKIPEMLRGFEKIDAYPLKNFLGVDYHGFSYSFLVFIFNNKPLINPFIRVFRTFYTLVK